MRKRRRNTKVKLFNKRKNREEDAQKNRHLTKTRMISYRAVGRTERTTKRKKIDDDTN
jgi:hypothetical protein